MRATDFEYRHQTLLRMLVVGLALLTYVIEPDDIVWAAVRNHTTYRALLERLVFGTGAFLIVSSALFQTWASAYAGLDAASESQVLACDGPYRYVQHPLYLGRIFFALGIGLLAPALGTVILLAGEIVLILRLLGRDYVGSTAGVLRPYREQVPRFLPSLRPRFPARGFAGHWREALRKEASKWGLAVTMIVFTLTLQDRIAEILASVSVLIWFVLNMPDFMRSRGSKKQP
jgi:protein-S-isoprenylcysteine O-methyltransferase Ste14